MNSNNQNPTETKPGNRVPYLAVLAVFALAILAAFLIAKHKILG